MLQLPTQNSTTLGFQKYKQSRDMHVIYYVMRILININYQKFPMFIYKIFSKCFKPALKYQLPTRNSTTLGFQRYKQSRDLRVIYYVMALLMLTIGNSQCLSTRVSQNALQTSESLNKLISLLIFNTVEKKS